MKTLYRNPTQREQLSEFTSLMHRLHTHRSITMNQEQVIKILDQMYAWTAAHSDCNGERSESEIRQNVASAFWEHIARDSSKGIKADRLRKKSTARKLTIGSL